MKNSVRNYRLTFAKFKAKLEKSPLGHTIQFGHCKQLRHLSAHSEKP